MCLDMIIRIKRVYIAPEDSDGKRILVDKLWPRGLNKDEAHIDAWIKEVAPSDDLRKWFNHDPKKWPMFKEKYFFELLNNPEAVIKLIKAMDDESTLLFAAKEEEFNNAVALKEYLEQH